MDAEALYRQLGRIIESAPDFSGYRPLTKDHLTWLGRAHALVQASGDLIAQAEFSMASNKVQSALRHDGINQVMLILYKLLGAAELKAPPNARGAFIPAGNSFDAFAAVSKVFQTAAKDILVVDPYLDETILTDFGGAVSQGVHLRLLSDISSVRPSLAPASNRWLAQHGATRPLGVRFAAARALHDRAIFVDGSVAWILTQSLKDFAKRSPAEIVRADDTAALKITAYEAVWATAKVIV
jgi:hypothetical protein